MIPSNSIGFCWYRKDASDMRKTRQAIVPVALAALVFSAGAPRSRCAQGIGLNHVIDVRSAQKKMQKLKEKTARQRVKHDFRGEATSLAQLAALQTTFYMFRDALDSDNQALEISHELNDRAGEATTLTNIANLYLYGFDNPANAIQFYTQAQLIFRELKNQRSEAETLNSIGNIYLNVLHHPQDAIDRYSEAQSILNGLQDVKEELVVLENLGSAYYRLYQLQDSLSLYKQALSISREARDLAAEAHVLNYIADVYQRLGEPQEALDLYDQSLPIEKRLHDEDAEAETIVDIGSVMLQLRQPQKVLDLYQNFPNFMYLSLHPRTLISVAINSGSAYLQLGEPLKALDSSKEALSYAKDDFDQAAGLLANGDAYNGLHQSQSALDSFLRALPLAVTVGDPVLQALVFDRLMRQFRDTEPPLSVYFGKRAINEVQNLRNSNRDLSPDLQLGLLGTAEYIYRDTADVLIDQGRLAEAQEVIDLMRLEQFANYTRAGAKSPTRQLSKSAAEEKMDQEYERRTQRLLAIYNTWISLRDKSNRTPTEQQQFQSLDSQVKQGFSEYHSLLDTLDTILTGADKAELDRARTDVSGLANLVSNLDPGTVALYTLVTGDRYRVIVIRSNQALVERHFDIKATDLRHLVSDFLSLIGQRKSDPQAVLSSSDKLYHVLVAPIAQDLRDADAHVLVWELDDVLHYIPVASLFDAANNQYLVQKYANVVITPRDTAGGGLKDRPNLDDAHLLAMGLSHQYKDDFIPLPNVPLELNSVVEDPKVSESTGPFRGTEWLDDDFTAANFERQLATRGYEIVHLATHYYADPAGDELKSFLLLAGQETGGPPGYSFTLHQFELDVSLQGVNLLTLSACDTAVATHASDGHEIDGLGGVGEELGAGAVMASLWEVSDESTGDLMADFYRRWKAGAGTVTKVEALRQAQLDLLTGTIVPKANAPNGPTSFKSPYYWAPFILMGNWR